MNGKPASPPVVSTKKGGKPDSPTTSAAPSPPEAPPKLNGSLPLLSLVVTDDSKPIGLGDLHPHHHYPIPQRVVLRTPGSWF